MKYRGADFWCKQTRKLVIYAVKYYLINAGLSLKYGLEPRVQHYFTNTFTQVLEV